MIILQPGKIFSYVSSLLPTNPIIVEAGSCDGRDTFQLARQFCQGTVYAFEPIPLLFDALRIRVSCFKNVICVNRALAHACGKLPFYVATKESTLRITQTSSLYAPNKEYPWNNTLFNEIVNVNGITLDAWAEQEHIKTIDFLWLDAQGSELAILSAAQHVLKTVRAIWMEVSDVQRYTNQPTTKDILSSLHGYGFKPIAESAPHKQQNPWKSMLFVKK